MIEHVGDNEGKDDGWRLGARVGDADGVFVGAECVGRFVGVRVGVEIVGKLVGLEVDGFNVGD